MAYEKRNDVNEIPAHVQRMHIERDELRDKVEKLGTFIVSNPLFDKLAAEDQQLMGEQIEHMAAYLTVLEARIARAEG